MMLVTHIKRWIGGALVAAVTSGFIATFLASWHRRR